MLTLTSYLSVRCVSWTIKNFPGCLEVLRATQSPVGGCGRDSHPVPVEADVLNELFAPVQLLFRATRTAATHSRFCLNEPIRALEAPTLWPASPPPSCSKTQLQEIKKKPL